MLSIAIFDDNKIYLNSLRELVQDYVIESKLTVKLTTFDNVENFLKVPTSYDIYIIDTNSTEDIIHLSLRMKEVDTESHFIFIGEDPSLAYSAY